MEKEKAATRIPDFLYHYTSFETLALILSNRTICFNSLLNVDDVEEAETEDMCNFGKYVYVSCWTDDSNELISLWNLYTPNMHGVRIGLPRFPFKKYKFKKGEYYLTEDVESYINLKKIYDENRVNIVPLLPNLERVIYTNDKTLLCPHIKVCNPPDSVERFLKAKTLKEAVPASVQYDLTKLGKYKREDWAFQKEWRYIILVAPMGLKEMNPSSLPVQQEYIRRMENPNTKLPYDRLFLDLDENAVKQMQVVLGPRMSNAEKIYVKSLLKDHGLENSWRDSTLRIR